MPVDSTYLEIPASDIGIVANTGLDEKPVRFKTATERLLAERKAKRRARAIKNGRWSI
jgi:hypothetical protein